MRSQLCLGAVTHLARGDGDQAQCRTGRGLRSTALISVNMGVLAPIPSASESTATMGERRAAQEQPQRIADVFEQGGHASSESP